MRDWIWRASRWRIPRTSKRAKSSQRAEEMVVELPVMSRIRRRGREGTRTLVRMASEEARMMRRARTELD